MAAHPTNGVKLFIGQIPRALSEEELRAMVVEYGQPTEVVVIKDRASGQSRGCGFVIYNTKEEADRCINGLHNKRIIPPMHHAVQVKYAEGETNRLEAKLFIGMIAKSASDDEVRRIFEPYGEIDELAILKDRSGTSKGCAFLKFRYRESAEEAIRQLNGKFKMADCPQHMTVQYADTERQKMEKRTQKFLGGPQLGGFGALANNPLAVSAALQLAANAGMNAGQFGGMGSANPAAAALAAIAAAANPGNVGSQMGGYYGGQPTAADLLGSYGQQGGMLGGGGGNPYAYLYGGGGGGYNDPTGGAGFQSPNAAAALAALMGGGGGGYDPQQGGGYQSQGAAALAALMGGGVPSALGRSPVQEGPPGANLFIYHLPEQFTDADLIQTFSAFGSVISAHVYADPATGLSKGFGFVAYDSPEAGAAAVMHMNGFQLGGKRLKVQVKKSNLPTAPASAGRPY